MASTKKLIPMQRVRDEAKSSKNDLWMVIENRVFDFTDFAKDHPGGPEYLRVNKGKDATAPFKASHPGFDTITMTLSEENLKKMYIGDVDPSTITKADIAANTHAEEGPVTVTMGPKPSIESCINLYDFEAIASRTMKEQGWAYYSSGADDEITLRENHSAFQRIWLRPRVLVNVKDIDMRTTIQGFDSAFPLYLSAAAMCKLGHPDGECSWTRAAASEGIIQMVPTLSSCAFEDIVEAKVEGQVLFFQLYVNSDRAKCQKIVEKAETLMDCKVLFITVDAPQLGNREKDRRVKVTHSGASVQKGTQVKKSEGTAKALTTFIDPSLCWEDIKWFKSITKMKIILKGVATREDVILAIENGCEGVVLSNHGGRQLDFARSGIEILPEVMDDLRARNLQDKIEVYVDGGIRRGTDIFKAVALGATAVGISRPVLYSMASFGQPGIERMLQILKDEFEMTMRLMGCKTVADIKPEMVVLDSLHQHVAFVPSDSLQKQTYVQKLTQVDKQQFKGRGDNAKEGQELALSPVRQELAVVRGELAELKALILSNKTATATSSSSSSSGQGDAALCAFLVLRFFQAILRSFFTIDPRKSIHRTAMVLTLYLVVHLFGNLGVFFGADGYNQNLATISHSPLVKAFEIYLLLAAVAHVVSGLFLTRKYKNLKGITKPSLSVAKRAFLILTGLVILVFIVVHVQHFRLATLPTDAQGRTDYYRAQLSTLSSPFMAAYYVMSVLVIIGHLFMGWPKTMLKMKADTKDSSAITELFTQAGRSLLLPLAGGFIACVVFSNMMPVEGSCDAA